MRKVIAVIAVILMCTSITATASGLNWSEIFEDEDNEFEKIHTTAYCLHGVTATGGTTRPGIAACNPHLGEIAMIYSLDGEYLGMYEVTDTGGTEGLKRGRVIDVWFDTYDECKEWMRLTGGKVMVKWIKGVG